MRSQDMLVDFSRFLPVHRSTRFLLALSACLTCQGCGNDDWQAETYPARGRVAINGAPAAGAVVELHSIDKKPDERNSRPWAVVRADGSYILSTYESEDGAPIGEYAVTVRWPVDVSKPSLVDRLSGAYARPERSQWRITVSPEENELPPVEITAEVLPPEQSQAVPGSPPLPSLRN